MKKGKIKALLVLLVIVLAGIYYYVTIPAINIHSTGIWIFILFVLVLILAAYTAKKKFTSIREVKSSKFLKIGGIVLMAVLLVFAAGSILSSPIVNAKQYRNLLTIEERDFSEDIQPVNFSQIPLLDKDSAMILGNRKMGSMVDMVSQFEVSDLYSQINYQEKPVRVTPLVYASPIKWLTNQSQGIPAYIMIDMTTQDTSLVKLDKPIRYSEAEYLNRNIYRHLRFHYPTYIFDQLSFEIDDNGTPYWVCPVRKYTIGLFGGATIGRVVLCNAQTGECQDYTLKDCPEWVDRANPADLLIQQYNYYGTLVHGYINSIFGQKGCLKSTDGYNYMAMEDDVWVYTGVTSVSGDQSNVGFVLINQRTRETRYYKVNGAEEYSAMGSAGRAGSEPWVQGSSPDPSEYFQRTNILYGIERRCRTGKKIRDGKYPEIPECCHRRYRIRLPGRLCETPEYQWNYCSEMRAISKLSPERSSGSRRALSTAIPISTWY